MRFTGPIFRPPVEAMLDSKLLLVTIGCAHNKCTFCSMYQSVNFTIESLEQIEQDIFILRHSSTNIKRVFLLNGDVFVLSKDKLSTIAKLIIKYIPEVEVITMYASISNIRSKSDQDLKELYDLRINDLWIGVETGMNQTLIDINKGHTLDEAREHLLRLNKFGIRHNDSFMLGVGGTGKGIENAYATAKLISETKPSIVWFGTLGLFEGSQLYEDEKKGLFTQATELENLEEEIKVLEHIDLDNVPFYGIHPTNTTPVHGVIPQDRDKMISIIKDSINKSSKDFLEGKVDRNKRRNNM